MLKRLFKPSNVFIVIVVFYLLYLIREDIVRNISLKRERENLLKNIASEEELNKSLKIEMTQLDKDSFIEGIAREKLGLIKKHEIPYKVVRQ